MTLLALIARSLVQARYVVLGSILLLWGFQLVIVGQASSIEQQNAFGRFAEFVPAFLQRGLGNRAMLLATFKGIVAFGYFHPVVVVLVSALAIYLMTEPAHEVESGLIDLELSRAVPRHAIVTRSLLSGLIAIGCAAALMGFGTWLGLRIFAQPHFDVPSALTVTVLLLHLCAVAALFGALGLLIASGARRWSSAFFTAALAAVLLYLVDFLSIGWPSMRAISWISPFHYYPALSLLAGDAPIVRDLTVLLCATAGLVALSFWQFTRRDL